MACHGAYFPTIPIKEVRPMLYEGVVISHYTPEGGVFDKEEKLVYGPDYVIAKRDEIAKNMILSASLKADKNNELDVSQLTVLVRPFK